MEENTNIQTRTSNNDEIILGYVATAILAIGLLATLIYILMGVSNNLFLDVLPAAIITALSSLTIWAFAKVMVNISITLKEINKKLKD